MPDDVRDLLEFLAANVDVSRADGLHDKAERYASFLGTVRALAAQDYQYVIVSLHRVGDGLMEPGATWGPYSSKEQAETALDAMSFPSPEWVHIRRLHTAPQSDAQLMDNSRAGMGSHSCGCSAPSALTIALWLPLYLFTPLDLSVSDVYVISCVLLLALFLIRQRIRTRQASALTDPPEPS